MKPGGLIFLVLIISLLVGWFQWCCLVLLDLCFVYKGLILTLHYSQKGSIFSLIAGQ